MPRPPKQPAIFIPLHQLNWASLLVAYNRYDQVLNSFEKPEQKGLKDIEEYTGENGQTLKEFTKEVSEYNLKVSISNSEALKESLVEYKEELKETSEQIQDLLKTGGFLHPNVLPHLMALFGKAEFKPVLVDGKVAILKSLINLRDKADRSELRFEAGPLISSNTLRAMVTFLKTPTRGHIYDTKALKAYTKEGHIFSACRPLLPSAWKLYQGINYSQYNYTDPELSLILEPNLVELFNSLGSDSVKKWSKEQLLELRDEAVAKSQFKAIKNTVRVNSNLSDSEFVQLPKFVQLCLLQLWVYMPKLYSSYSIANLIDPDAKPEPLVDTEVFQTDEATVKFKSKSLKEEYTW